MDFGQSALIDCELAGFMKPKVRPMHFFRLVPAVMLLVVATGNAEAVTYPPSTVLVGATALTVAATNFGASCYIGHGLSTFQRNAAASTAIMSFAEIVDSNAWDLGGQAKLTFTSATAGGLVFINTAGYPANVKSPTFSNFSETYSSGKLIISFTIAFPDCNLNVLGAYDG